MLIKIVLNIDATEITAVIGGYLMLRVFDYRIPDKNGGDLGERMRRRAPRCLYHMI